MHCRNGNNKRRVERPRSRIFNLFSAHHNWPALLAHCKNNVRVRKMKIVAFFCCCCCCFVFAWRWMCDCVCVVFTCTGTFSSSSFLLLYILNCNYKWNENENENEMVHCTAFFVFSLLDNNNNNNNNMQCDVNRNYYCLRTRWRSFEKDNCRAHQGAIIIIARAHWGTETTTNNKIAIGAPWRKLGYRSLLIAFWWWENFNTYTTLQGAT